MNESVNMKGILIGVILLVITVASSNTTVEKKSIYPQYKDVPDFVESTLWKPMAIFSTSWCEPCKRVKDILNQYPLKEGRYVILDIDEYKEERDILAYIYENTTKGVANYVPLTFFQGYIGPIWHSPKGASVIEEMHKNGELKKKLDELGVTWKTIKPEYKDAKDFVTAMIKRPLFILSTTWCPGCTHVHNILKKYNLIEGQYAIVDCDTYKEDHEIFKYIYNNVSHVNYLPQVFFKGELKGGSGEISGPESKGELNKLLKELGAIPEKDDRCIVPNKKDSSVV